MDPAAPDPAVIARAGAVLARGGLVAFPTETVYGLGANALDPAAVARVFAAKGRPADNPLIVHVATLEELPRVAGEVPPLAQRLARRFWPGPLTLVLPRAAAVPAAASAGLATVAVRMPDHPVALALIHAAGVPVAAPSANRSGRPSPTCAGHVAEDLGDAVDLLLDAGPTRIGVESTVLDVTEDPAVLLRPGGVTLEELEEVLGPGGVRVWPEAGAGTPESGPARSPGMKYVHYAPAAPVYLYTGERAAVRAALAATLHDARSRGERVGLLATEATLAELAPLASEAESLGREPAEAATRLFASLRALDSRGVASILVEGIAETGLGFAVMNRLRRAATREVAAG